MPKSKSTGAHELDPFHAHLHDCHRCFNHPHDLCPTGANLLRLQAIQAAPLPSRVKPAEEQPTKKIRLLDQHRHVCEQCWTNAETGQLELCQEGWKIMQDERAAPQPPSADGSGLEQECRKVLFNADGTPWRNSEGGRANSPSKCVRRPADCREGVKRMAKSPKFKRIGWTGICDNKPYFSRTTDEYIEFGKPVGIADVFKSRKEARKRFEATAEVFVRERA